MGKEVSSDTEGLAEERSEATIQISTSKGQLAAALQRLHRLKNLCVQSHRAALWQKIKRTAFLAWRVFTFSRKHDKCKEKVDKLEQEKQGMLKGLDYAEGKAVELQEKVLDLEKQLRDFVEAFGRGLKVDTVIEQLVWVHNHGPAEARTVATEYFVRNARQIQVDL
jgi:chromosome segregation ATPase